MQLIFLVIVYPLALYGAWTVGCKVRDWINDDTDWYSHDGEHVDDAAIAVTNNTKAVCEILHDMKDKIDRAANLHGTEVKAKRQPRKVSPKTPSGNTGRKRSTKSGK